MSSAANGVYAFGFLMMTPQIFINYKVFFYFFRFFFFFFFIILIFFFQLKSVAHMPWRAMTYKVSSSS